MSRAPALALVVLLGAAVAARGQDAMEDGGPMGAARRVQRDPGFFRDRVLPVLAKHCGGCHGSENPDNATQHRLELPAEGATFTDDQVERNFKGVDALLHPTDPARSRLLLKLVPVLYGGVDHDGGKADGEEFPFDLIDPKGDLIAWIFGATPTSRPPVAVTGPVPRNVPLGEPLTLDATLSFDPEGAPVTVRWEVIESPLGAKARLIADDEKVTSITPDREGPWILRVHPSDGKLSGWPRIVRFAAVRSTPSASGAGTAPPTTAVVAPSDRRAVRSLFLDLQGRTPTAEELAALAALPHADRVDRMLGEIATWETWFDEEAFYFLLIDRFRPVSDRLAEVPRKLMDKLLSVRDAHTEFALSAEFNARNPGNDTYVTVVLEQFLGIEVQAEPRLLKAAKDMYDGKPSKLFKEPGANQSDVVHIALRQPGYTDLFLRRMEDRYLGGPLPDDEHEVWVATLRKEPRDFPLVLRAWLLSDRYLSPSRPPRAKNDHQFIRSLYVDLLGRIPSYEEFRNMRNALQALADPAPLRGVLAKVMLDSNAVQPPAAIPAAGDVPTAPAPPVPAPGKGATTAPGIPDSAVSPVVEDLFRRFLGRDPTPPELDAFKAVLTEPGATWKTAALALLTSAHYQYY